ncbi:hypothetical protein ACFXPA_32295 [Amycolatopsis sp. NPDC059090]|uniref:hypothetical protein n=1 Tax=unclassified Amycolatopsis TaxID=2618356 RepID=UPI003672F745
MPTRVLPDANVLHARTLRDWLLLLKDTGNASMFHVFYTEDILAETIQSIRRRNPGLTGTVLAEARPRHAAQANPVLLREWSRTPGLRRRASEIRLSRLR